MYWFCSRIPLRCLFVLSLATGCAGCRVMDQRNRGDTVAQYEQMREQQRWWDQNRHRAEYVQGRGWYLADTGQYYDGTGRPIGDAADQVEQVAIEHEEEEVTAVAFKPLEDRLKSFVPRQIISQLKQATGNGPDQQEAREALEEANKAYREANSLSDSNDGKKREKYLTAAGRYASAARAWPDSAIEEEALFKVGECYFFADDLPEAENQFEKLVKKNPNTRFLDLIGSRSKSPNTGSPRTKTSSVGSSSRICLTKRSHGSTVSATPSACTTEFALTIQREAWPTMPRWPLPMLILPKENTKRPICSTRTYVTCFPIVNISSKRTCWQSSVSC